MRGVHQKSGRGTQKAPGSSPHARGPLVEGEQTQDIYGFIPACAGSTLSMSGRTILSQVHPRMRGVHEKCADAMTNAGGSSPHARGPRA